MHDHASSTPSLVSVPFFVIDIVNIFVISIGLVVFILLIIMIASALHHQSRKTKQKR